MPTLVLGRYSQRPDRELVHIRMAARRARALLADPGEHDRMRAADAIGVRADLPP
jgi:uncharacterized protein (UPF0147 family)